MSPPRQGRYKLAGERTPRAAENHAAPTPPGTRDTPHSARPHLSRNWASRHAHNVLH